MSTTDSFIDLNKEILDLMLGYAPCSLFSDLLNEVPDLVHPGVGGVIDSHESKVSGI